MEEMKILFTAPTFCVIALVALALQKYHRPEVAELWTEDDMELLSITHSSDQKKWDDLGKLAELLDVMHQTISLADMQKVYREAISSPEILTYQLMYPPDVRGNCKVVYRLYDATSLFETTIIVKPRSADSS